jgi:hypothetical protein
MNWTYKMKSKNEQLDEIYEASGFPDNLSVEMLPEWIRNLRIGHARYAKIKNLSPMQYAVMYRNCLETGKPFDEALDQL